ncbi:MAG: hypothetical protein DRQ78_11490 [Epsilonproteobacteria bacterium]|nr:MAG: hypothetical protein DRQ78_11490 [Campylobacterota bacterium]
MREVLEYRLVKLFLWLSKIAPKSFIYASMKMFSLMAYYLIGRRRKITIQNLSMAFPLKSKEEIKLLSKQVYVELSKTISEILLMYVDRFDIDAAIKNAEEAKQKLEVIAKNSPRGVIVVTAHFSNWELAAHFLAKHGLPMLAIGRRGNNKLIDTNLTLPFRERYGNEAVHKKQAMMGMIRRLKKAGNVGLLIDQKSGSMHSAKVDFFGKPAETTLSIASLKLKFDALVVPMFVVRSADGCYEIIIHESVVYMAEELEEQEKKLEAMTLKYTKVIEETIEKYPAQWFWMHNRWRL